MINVEVPKVFSAELLLEHVTKHIVCTDQVGCIIHPTTIEAVFFIDGLYFPQALAHTDVMFRNCLIVMRPKTLPSELPTHTTVRTRIENKFAG